jgi:hypothetical protein
MRRLSSYLTHRQGAANQVAVVMPLAALGLATCLWVEGMDGGGAVVAAGLTALALVACCVWAQLWLVARPRASLASSDLFWQEHLFVLRLGELPVSGFMAGAAALVLASATILSQDEPGWMRILAVAGFIAVPVALFFLAPDDRDAKPEVLRTLEAPA